MPEILKADLEGIAKAARVVAGGGVLCYPTDTLYGLGCDPLNASAVARTMAAKGDRVKPMPVLVRDLAVAEKLGLFSQRARQLAGSFWPGPLTLVLRAQPILPPLLVPEGKVGLRSPKHPICLELLALSSGALVGTSANLTGRPPATTANEALKQIGDRVDMILDGGQVPLGVASTVVDLTEARVKILREGPIGLQELLRSLRKSESR